MSVLLPLLSSCLLHRGVTEEEEEVVVVVVVGSPDRDAIYELTCKTSGAFMHLAVEAFSADTKPKHVCFLGVLYVLQSPPPHLPAHTHTPPLGQRNVYLYHLYTHMAGSSQLRANEMLSAVKTLRFFFSMKSSEALV